jgi:uncharacterized membrane protein YeaQ/YmgE (transglycosylase-associated protein family)
MTFQAIVIAVVVGLVAGWLAGLVMKGGGYGLMGDVLLGIGGSFVGGWLFHVLGMASGTAGWFAMIAVAFVGAVLLIVAQRLLFEVRA